MLRTSHLIVTASGWGAVSVVGVGRGLLDASSLAVAAGFAMAGSVGPDIDLKLPFVAHRGATHSILATLAFAALGVALARYLRLDPAIVGAGAAWGWGSHLLADTCTPHGVPYLWPMKHRTSWDLFPTGSLRETVVVAAWVAVCAVAAYVGLFGRAVKQLQ